MVRLSPDQLIGRDSVLQTACKHSSLVIRVRVLVEQGGGGDLCESWFWLTADRSWGEGAGALELEDGFMID